MKISNAKRYVATLKSTLPGPFAGDDVKVASTAEHPASSYGFQQWVDSEGNAYGQIDLPLFGWEIAEVKEVSAEAADAFLDGEED